ncbi:hypothetical protein BY458DRAFT_499616 [Sporodiniella umbellata]|nr:hypothetical protein BY458DRAFT_499616 [Sporodiniella umbellata]
MKSPKTAWNREARSFDSCSTDEGYHTDDIHSTEQAAEIPIQKSSRSLQITYTKSTYTLTLSIVVLSALSIFCQPFPWTQTFPPIFNLFQLLFHLLHLHAHVYNWLHIERHCVVYGTWLYYTGWLLGKLLFSERLANHDYSYPTHALFWILMIERRNAWGMIVWEFMSRLQNTSPDSLCNIRLFTFRLWCLLGTGSFWGCVYIGLASRDGFQFNYLLQLHHIIKLLWISGLGGLIMSVFWSFWTFQYKGVLWQKELREGIVVWCSEGVAHAAQVL